MGRVFFAGGQRVSAFTISSNLSGSYNAAMAARTMVLEEHPEKKIFVLDTLSCSGALAGAAELANKLIGENQEFDDICFALKSLPRAPISCLLWRALTTWPRTVV